MYGEGHQADHAKSLTILQYKLFFFSGVYTPFPRREPSNKVMDSIGATASLLILTTAINHGPGLLVGIDIDIEALWRVR